jgi:hypothetical protein
MVLMFTNLMQMAKEVIALDADDHLLRPTLILSDLSEMRQLQVKVDRVPALSLVAGTACTAWFGAHRAG